jgi:predicted component of type VI protein secretion system
VLDERGEPAAAPEGGIAPAEAAPARPGSVLSRSEAYQRLIEAADFLLRTEPHSPVPYLVRRAVSWGNLSLADLLQELLQKNADLPTLYTLLGIKRTS